MLKTFEVQNPLWKWKTEATRSLNLIHSFIQLIGASKSNVCDIFHNSNMIKLIFISLHLHQHQHLHLHLHTESIKVWKPLSASIPSYSSSHHQHHTPFLPLLPPDQWSKQIHLLQTSSLNQFSRTRKTLIQLNSSIHGLLHSKTTKN